LIVPEIPFNTLRAIRSAGYFSSNLTGNPYWQTAQEFPTCRFGPKLLLFAYFELTSKNPEAFPI